MVDIAIDRSSTDRSGYACLTNTEGDHIRRFFVVDDPTPDELSQLIVLAQLQPWPSGRDIEIMDILSTVAAVDEFLAPFCVYVFDSAPLQLPLNRSGVAVQHRRDVPRGVPPSGHPLHHHALFPCQMLAFPATLIPFHAVLLPLCSFVRPLWGSDTRRGTLPFYSCGISYYNSCQRK